MANLDTYNKLRKVPQEAIKPILSGRMKGKSDINPMWRIKVFTETFGMCGIGWKYVINKLWLETFGNEVKAFCDIDLYVKVDGEWSEPIPGIGGSTFVAIERSGAYVSDECYKMALTDALSVSMKALGVAADIYFERDCTKYTEQPAANNANAAATTDQPTAQQYHPDNLQEAMYMLTKCQTKDQVVWLLQTYQPLCANPQFMQSVSAKKKELHIA